MPAPLLAPAGQLQGWIITDLLTDPGSHANLLGWPLRRCCLPVC